MKKRKSETNIEVRLFFPFKPLKDLRRELQLFHTYNWILMSQTVDTLNFDYNCSNRNSSFDFSVDLLFQGFKFISNRGNLWRLISSILTNLQNIFSFAKLKEQSLFLKIHKWIVSCIIDPISANKSYKDDMKIINFGQFHLIVKIFSRSNPV